MRYGADWLSGIFRSTQRVYCRCYPGIKKHGVLTKILTGDNEKVTWTICKQVGLKVRNMLLGSNLEHMSDAELARAAKTTEVFAKQTPKTVLIKKRHKKSRGDTQIFVESPLMYFLSAQHNILYFYY